MKKTIGIILLVIVGLNLVAIIVHAGQGGEAPGVGNIILLLIMGGGGAYLISSYNKEKVETDHEQETQ